MLKEHKTNKQQKYQELVHHMIYKCITTNVIGHRAAPNSMYSDFSPLLLFYHLYLMESLSKEERVQVALKSFKKGQYKTKKAAALAFDVPETTL